MGKANIGTVKSRRGEKDKECEAFRSPRTWMYVGKKNVSTTMYFDAYTRFAYFKNFPYTSEAEAK